ncbi:MAG: TonB-dependent receptor plug domain-containing protein [Bacteroidales bacterium]
MNRRCLLLLLVFLVLQPLRAQRTDLRVSGHFENLSLAELADTLRVSRGIHLFFREAWVPDVRISVSGDSLSLVSLLEQSLAGRSLHVVPGPGNNLYILPFSPGGESAERDAPGEGLRSGEIPGKEALYFGGKKLEAVRQVARFGQRGTEVTGNRVTLYGTIRDLERGETQAGVSLAVAETGKGSVSDGNGDFQLTLRPGQYTLHVRSVGMREIVYDLDLFGSGRLDIAMEREIIPLDEVQVSARLNDPLAGVRLGEARIDAGSMKEIPLVLGEKDVLRVAQMLPGVQQSGEGSSGFHVRGSSSDQNLFYVNHVPVYNTAHLFGFFSSLSPDIIKDFTLYKGHIPAEYGGRIASVFDVSTREGNTREFGARGGIGPVTGHLAAEGPLKKDKHSYVLSARSSYSDWILERMEDPELRTSTGSFSDFSGGLNFRAGERDQVRFFAYHSRDRFQYGPTVGYGYENTGGSLIWKRRVHPDLRTETAAVFSRYGFQTRNRELANQAYSHAYRLDHSELKTHVQWTPLLSHLFRFGGSIVRYDLDRGSILPLGEESLREGYELGRERGLESALHVSDLWQPGEKFSLYAGLRLSHFALLGPASVYTYPDGTDRRPGNILDTLSYGPAEAVSRRWGPDVRLALTYRPAEAHSVKLSYNRMHQYLFLLSNTVAIAPTDQWKLADTYLVPPRGDQVSAGYYTRLPWLGLDLSTEWYYKVVHHVAEYRNGADFTAPDPVESAVLQGTQRAWGWELLLEKETGRLNGWLAYTWSRSWSPWTGPCPGPSSTGGPFPANYDIPIPEPGPERTVHPADQCVRNLVSRRADPSPYPESAYVLNGMEIVSYSDRNAYRIPDYFRIDLSLNLEGNLKARKLAHSSGCSACTIHRPEKCLFRFLPVRRGGPPGLQDVHLRGARFQRHLELQTRKLCQRLTTSFGAPCSV